MATGIGISLLWKDIATKNSRVGKMECASAPPTVNSGYAYGCIRWRSTSPKRKGRYRKFLTPMVWMAFLSVFLYSTCACKVANMDNIS